MGRADDMSMRRLSRAPVETSWRNKCRITFSLRRFDVSDAARVASVRTGGTRESVKVNDGFPVQRKRNRLRV